MALPRPLSLCVTGTPRSGTGYIARVLGAAGIDARHNGLFTEDGITEIAPHAEVSWMAMPHLAPLRRTGTTIGLVFRHPLAVVSSILGSRFFLDESAQRDYAYDHLLCLLSGDPFEEACDLYSGWNRRCLTEAHFTFDVEYPSFDRLASAVNAPLSSVAAAVASVSQTVNHGPRADVADLELPSHVWDTYRLLKEAARAS